MARRGRSGDGLVLGLDFESHIVILQRTLSCRHASEARLIKARRTPPIIHAALCGALVPALVASPSSAQDTIRVSGDELTCPACVITVDSVLTIGGLDGPGLEVIDEVSRVAVDRMGRVLVSVYRSPEISVFDSTGTFLRTFGRSGEGPGEYQFINHVNAGPRYIHVLDMRGRTVLDYDFGFVRADPFPAQRVLQPCAGIRRCCLYRSCADASFCWSSASCAESAGRAGVVRWPGGGCWRSGMGWLADYGRRADALGIGRE